MAHRHFEGKAHALLYSKYRPVPPEQLITRIVTFIKEKYAGTLDLAVDVGCGSGQSTKFFSPHFAQVFGIDISPAQIETAIQTNQCANVTFKVGPAEVIPAENASVQLITASTAAHWFDLPKFYDEGLRALCPGGVMALFCYELPKFRWDQNPEKNAVLDGHLQRLYQVDLNGYWAAAEKQLADDRYIDLVIPYDEFLREYDFHHDTELTVRDMANSVQTWSGYQKYCTVNGHEAGEALLEDFTKRIMSVLEVDTSPEETAFTTRTSFFLLLGRKAL